MAILEKDEENYRLKVIGYMRSPFLYKNGTPRQPGICHQVTGEITIDKKIFNNPEHSLEGLEKFSHIWIFFIFHKNNNAHFKAKVKPPRLNGSKTGVFSTRSPYRPNNIGLTLAKVECIKGDTVTVSGIDILDGTPIIDLKPFIPQYDNPALQTSESCENQSEFNEGSDNQSVCTDLSINQSKNYEEVGQSKRLDGAVENTEKNGEIAYDHQHKDIEQVESGLVTDSDISQTNKFNSLDKPECDISNIPQSDIARQCKSDFSDNFKKVCDSEGAKTGGTCISNVQTEVNRQNVSKQTDSFKLPKSFVETGANNLECSSTADWITKSPVSQLIVRFTPSAEEQLKLFSAEGKDGDFRLQFLKSYTQAKEAIINILHEDPRSTYRRNHCSDALYFFTLDVLHITCWFDQELVEIVKIRPIGKVEKLKEKKSDRTF